MPPMENRLKTADEVIGIWVIRAGVLGNTEEYFTKKERIVLEEQPLDVLN
jgi:hypothetical protein